MSEELEKKLRYLSLNLVNMLDKLEWFFGKAELNQVYIKEYMGKMADFKSELANNLDGINDNVISR